MKRIWILLGSLALMPFAQAGDPVEKVLACMQANVPAALRVQEVEFATTDGKGVTSALKGRLYAEREQDASGVRRVRAMLKLSAPQNLAGAAYLIREKDGDTRDGMYVYLPSVKRVRRVTGSFADGGLMGTSFSYADFKLLQNTFGDAQVTLEGTGESIEKRTTHLLSVRPADPAETSYSHVRIWVDDRTCVPLKAEFHENGVVRKTLVTPARALQPSGQQWYPSVVEMTDRKDGTHTVLRVQGVAPQEKLSGAYFDPATFYQR